MRIESEESGLILRFLQTPSSLSVLYLEVFMRLRQNN